ncbi:hypothetical protein IEQ34_011814 [Dendrobium chrysotoxum]|uniref:Uncharacterized protein n=1 Tax=Dendrobium chrysotoxum TaxID=161865 RepID=A0AAV7GB73_DENCH|nr:hypothetical protein IEQ34_011814 [Dendrobium chrysotoxum]
MAKLVEAIYNKKFFKHHASMGMGVHARDTSKYYALPKDHEHNNNECRHSRNLVKDLIKPRKLKELVLVDLGRQAGKVPMEETPPFAHLVERESLLAKEYGWIPRQRLKSSESIVYTVLIIVRAKRSKPPSSELKVDDTTESSLLSLIAFEHIHVTVRNEVTAYLFLMDGLINTADDVALLRNEKIIKDLVSSDGNISKIFNKIIKKATLAATQHLKKGHSTISLAKKDKYNR